MPHVPPFSLRALAGLVMASLPAGLLGQAAGVAAVPERATTIRVFAASKPVVALTFDAGADRGYTEVILDTLAVKGVGASFSLTGQWAEANPDLVQRMVRAGHHLVNHSWSHRAFTGRSTGTAPLSVPRNCAAPRS